MELIIQTLSRSGKVRNQQKVQGDKIKIGRAYDNQLILEDIHVSEHHALVSQNEAGDIQIEDLNSLNHLYTDDKRQINSAHPVQSGDEFYLGKLRIKILYLNHPVAETIALTKSEETAELFSCKRFNTIIFALFIALYGLSEYLSFFGEFKLKQLFVPVLSLIFALAIWPVFWSLLSRFFKHEARFWAHGATLIMTLFSLKALTLLTQLIAYNFDSGLATGINVAAGFIIVFACLRFSLYLFNQKSDKRQLWLGFSLTCFIFTLVSLNYYVKHRDFSPSPTYSSVILPSQFLFKNSKDINSFVESNRSLYQQAQEESAESSDESQADETPESEPEGMPNEQNPAISVR